MKQHRFAVFSLPLGLFLGCSFLSIAESILGAPVKIELTGIFKLWWRLDLYEGIHFIGVILAVLSLLTAWTYVFKKPWYFSALGGACATAIATVVHYNNPPRLLCFFDLNPNMPIWQTATFYILLSFVFCLAGYLCGLGWRWDLDHPATPVRPSETKSSLPHHRSPINLGFSLVEVLVVVMILAILAAILFPVFARSQRSAWETQDRSNLHQVYLAVCLYEQDNNDKSPANLLLLIPHYAPPAVFYSHLDPRGKGIGNQWPVNLYQTIGTGDGDSATLLSPNPISFAYLRSYSMRFHPGDTWDKYRSDPNVGMLVDGNLEFHGDPELDPPSQYNPPNAAAGNFIKFLVCRMDGSITVRQGPDCGSSASTYEIMFLFWPFGNCTSGGAGPA